MENVKELGEKKISKLLLKFSLPAIIAMTINAIYNIMDRVFIGKYVGEEALAGLTIDFPIMLILFAFATMIGIGTATKMSVKLGEKDQEKASKAFGNGVILAILLSVIVLIVGLLTKDQILSSFDISTTVFNYADDYLSIILVGFIFQMLGYLLASTVRTEGFPLLAMISMVSAGIVNIILDFIFIGILDLGVEGAAFATIIGQLVGFLIVLQYYVFQKNLLKIKLSHFKLDLKIIKAILVIGIATFFTTVGAGFSMVMLNKYLLEHGGTQAITSLGAINSLFTLFIMPIFGLQQGLQPIIGYNFGNNKKDRVIEGLKKAIIVGIVMSIIVFALFEIFPEFFISLFIDSKSDTIQVAKEGLRIFMLAIPILCINILGISYFQSTNRGKTAIFLGLLRQFICLLPLILILPNIYGLFGVWVVTPIADTLAVVITIIFLVVTIRKDNQIKNV